MQEEKQHRLRQLPVDKKEVEHYRRRWREINARPIKKVAEAKARKKRRVKRGAACCSSARAGVGKSLPDQGPPRPRCLRSWSKPRRRQRLW